MDRHRFPAPALRTVPARSRDGRGTSADVESIDLCRWLLFAPCLTVTTLVRV
jgi:hypothetical protein